MAVVGELESVGDFGAVSKHLEVWKFVWIWLLGHCLQAAVVVRQWLVGLGSSSS
jgi:hypothetical protein